MGKRNRVFIMGLDGATWKVFSPLMEEGIMPNLKGLVKEGASGELQSTIPPISAPAWASFQTGVNPGKHSIYDFVTYHRETRRTSLASSFTIKTRTIWEMASQASKTVVSINVPMTYPPCRVKGVIIGGLMSPGTGSNFTYPKGIYNELVEQLGDYKIFEGPKSYYKYGLDKFIHRLIYIENKRIESALYLMKKYDWDLFMVHNHSLDVVQHLLWHCLNKDHPGFDNRRYEYVLRFYKAMDENIGIVMKRLDDFTTLILTSDHGFGGAYKRINLNNWLEEKGYLTLKPVAKTGDFLIRLIKRFDILNLKNKLLPYFLQDSVRRTLSENLFIDWEATQAFTLTDSGYGLIYLNFPHRDFLSVGYENRRDELRKKLEQLRDPTNGMRVVESVYKKEDIYKGDFVSQAPDLIVEPKDGYSFCTRASMGGKEAFEEIDYRKSNTGVHRREGIFVFHGSHINRGMRKDRLRIVDLAPMMLALLGISIPEYMDGKIDKDIFEDIGSLHINYTREKVENDQRGGSIYSDRDKREIEARLKDLGYL